MFYKEKEIKNILKCQKCNNYLDRLDLPRILPSGYTICNVCNDKILKHASSDKFKCFLCFIEHSMPAKGFIINDIISKLIKKEPKIISLRKINSYHSIEMFYKECDIKNFLSYQNCNQSLEHARVFKRYI